MLTCSILPEKPREAVCLHLNIWMHGADYRQMQRDTSACRSSSYHQSAGDESQRSATQTAWY